MGYGEGQNVALEIRSAEGRRERFPVLADDLVRLKVDVILAVSNPAIVAARKATTSIPIVMTAATDPVDVGFVASLARPGGNITGLTVRDAGRRRVNACNSSGRWLQTSLVWLSCGDTGYPGGRLQGSARPRLPLGR